MWNPIDRFIAHQALYKEYVLWTLGLCVFVYDNQGLDKLTAMYTPRDSQISLEISHHLMWCSDWNLNIEPNSQATVDYHQVTLNCYFNCLPFFFICFRSWGPVHSVHVSHLHKKFLWLSKQFASSQFVNLL